MKNGPVPRFARLAAPRPGRPFFRSSVLYLTRHEKLGKTIKGLIPHVFHKRLPGGSGHLFWREGQCPLTFLVALGAWLPCALRLPEPRRRYHAPSILSASSAACRSISERAWA
jgi:hypothetical protein